MDITDYIMEDISVELDIDDDTRSPRTPTFAPNSPSICVSPFDHTRFFATSPTEPVRRISIPLAPAKPLAWVWQCHLCRQRYPLGVTRRCLLDGHYYCSGENDQPNLKRKKKRQSCSSEFDYVGWRQHGEWRRRVFQVLSNPRTLRGCEKCEFPSECRFPRVAVAVGPRTAELPVTETYDDDEALRLSQENRDNLLKKPLETLKQDKTEVLLENKKSKIVDHFEAAMRASESASRKNERSKKKRSRKQNALSPIEEENSGQDVHVCLSDLVMP